MEHDVEGLIYKPVKTKQDVDKLLSIHKNLVYWTLGKMGRLHDQECESAAWEALWDAINRFDVFSNVAFSSFAVKCIRNRVNDILRKRKLRLENETDFTDYFEAADRGTLIPLQIEAVDELIRVQTILDEYIDMKSGVSKNVLLVWKAANFEISAQMLARICNTSSTTVGKVLIAFRAYLATKLRD